LLAKLYFISDNLKKGKKEEEEKHKNKVLFPCVYQSIVYTCEISYQQQQQQQLKEPNRNGPIYVSVI
jgi:hypothetical protein